MVSVSSSDGFSFSQDSLAFFSRFLFWVQSPKPVKPFPWGTIGGDLFSLLGEIVSVSVSVSVFWVKLGFFGFFGFLRPPALNPIFPVFSPPLWYRTP